MGWIRSWFAYLILWAGYLSIFSVGQTFLTFQWDILLLEVGFLAIFLAFADKNGKFPMILLIRWLLFRLMFASGVVKLTSDCPTWWGLTALHYHFETQPIPTALAWYAHNYTTDFFKKISVLSTFYIEILGPFLFFAPSVSIRIFGAILQIFFQSTIVVTGNYNFFNLLTIILSFSLLDDQTLISAFRLMNFQMQDIQTVKEIEKPKEIENKESEKSESKEPESNKEKKNQEDQKIKVKNKEKNRDLGVVSFFKFAFSVALFGLTVWVSYLSVSFSTVPLKADAPLLDQIFKGFDAELTFKMDDLQKFIDNTLYISYGFMAVYLVYAISFMLRKFSVPNLIILLVIPTTFGISLVPFTHSLSHNLVNDIPEVFRNAYELSSDFHLSSSYGLFRRMTTTRPEITIQGSDDGKTWLNYEFPYKAGNVTRAPPFVAPHQPRLDWQDSFCRCGLPLYLNFVIILGFSHSVENFCLVPKMLPISLKPIPFLSIHQNTSRQSSKTISSLQLTTPTRQINPINHSTKHKLGTAKGTWALPRKRCENTLPLSH